MVIDQVMTVLGSLHIWSLLGSIVMYGVAIVGLYIQSQHGS